MGLCEHYVHLLQRITQRNPARHALLLPPSLPTCATSLPCAIASSTLLHLHACSIAFPYAHNLRLPLNLALALVRVP
jgi:hypothetical protein